MKVTFTAADAETRRDDAEEKEVVSQKFSAKPLRFSAPAAVSYALITRPFEINEHYIFENTDSLSHSEGLYLLPLPGLRRFQYRVGHIIRRQAVPERRRRDIARAERIEKIGELVDEGVFVADLQPRH